MKKRLSMPCPRCMGTVWLNGSVTCEKCGAEWKEYARPGFTNNGLMVSVNPADYMFFAEIVKGESQKAIETIDAITPEPPDYRGISKALNHIERAARALGYMSDSILENSHA